MPILNYTTTITPEKSAGEILGILARGGARSISIDYDGQGNPNLLVTPQLTLHEAFVSHQLALPEGREGTNR